MSRPYVPALVIPRGRRFNTATSAGVRFTDPVAVRDLQALTIAMLVRPSSFVAARTLMSKGNQSATNGWVLDLNGTTGSLRFFRPRATTSMSATTSSLLVLDTPQWVIACVDMTGTTGPVAVRLHLGGFNARLYEAAWSTRTVGSGATVTDLGVPLTIGNRDTVANGTVSFSGDILLSAVFARQFSPGEVRAFVAAPRAWRRVAAAWCEPGLRSARCPEDVSGQASIPDGTTTCPGAASMLAAPGSRWVPADSAAGPPPPGPSSTTTLLCRPSYAN